MKKSDFESSYNKAIYLFDLVQSQVFYRLNGGYVKLQIKRSINYNNNNGL